MKIKICPKCGSKKIEILKEGKFPGIPVFPYGAPKYYRCKKCGFTSTFFPEKSADKKDKINPRLR